MILLDIIICIFKKYLIKLIFYYNDFIIKSLKNMIIIWSWIIIQDKRVLLIKRSQNKKVAPNLGAFPWWKQELNETNEETTIREVKEEVWLDFEIEKLFEKFLDERGSYHYIFLWKTSWKIVLQIEECDGYGWFSYEEIKYLEIVFKDVIEKLKMDGLIE
jgi:8-oxo-dGTP pyrophosphatase MutT (NUDIX family)